MSKFYNSNSNTYNIRVKTVRILRDLKWLRKKAKVLVVTVIVPALKLNEINKVQEEHFAIQEINSNS